MVTKYCPLGFRGVFQILGILLEIILIPMFWRILYPQPPPPLPHLLVFVYLEMTPCVVSWTVANL